MRWIKTWGSYLLLCVLLAGCSLFQDVKSVAKPGVYGDFELSGRVAVQADGEGCSDGFYFSYVVVVVGLLLFLEIGE